MRHFISAHPFDGAVIGPFNPRRRRRGAISRRLIVALCLAAICVIFVVALNYSRLFRSISADTADGPSTSNPVDSPNDKNRTPAPDTPRADTSVDASTALLASRPFDHLVKDQYGKSDPGRDGWDTEVISAAATKQLKAMGKLIENRVDPDAASLAKLVADDFQCDPLRPFSLKTAFADPTYHVRRGDDDPDRAAIVPPSTRGPEVLAAALRALAESIGEARDIRVKFKLHRVKLSRDGFSTSAIFQLSARRTDAAIQQNCTWHCDWAMPEPNGVPRLLKIRVEAFEEVLAGVAGAPVFDECTAAVLGHNASYREQLAYGTDHWRGRWETNLGVDIAGFMGIAVGDVNGDGLDDVYITQQGGLPNLLFVQQPDGTAVDQSAASGVDWLDRCRSALLIDWDNDGDQDLVVATSTSLLLMSNDGKGRFTLRTTWPTKTQLNSLAAADYDRDGDLDLYLCGRDSTDNLLQQGVLGMPMPYHDANNGARNALLRNDGNWRLTDVTVAVGLDANNRRFSFAASWEDYDNDGDQDLYVANDYGRNCLYRNEQGHFTEVAAAAGVEDIAAGMSVSWGDVNNDGWMDVYVSNMFSAAGGRITYQRRFKKTADDAAKAQYQRHARGNTLFENSRGRSFRDVSMPAAVTMGRWAWASKFADLNNDGWEDLYVTNGFITGEKANDL